MQRKSEYVVEHQPSKTFLTKTYGRWTSDINLAQRFASRTKARDFIHVLYGEDYVVDLVLRELTDAE